KDSCVPDADHLGAPGHREVRSADQVLLILSLAVLSVLIMLVVRNGALWESSKTLVAQCAGRIVARSAVVQLAAGKDHNRCLTTELTTEPDKKRRKLAQRLE